MPTYSYNPLSGEQSGLTAQDRLRQANADRMIQMTLANMQDARSAAQMNAAERLGYAQIAGNKDLATISGDYGLRGQELANQAQFGIEGLRGQNAANLAGIAGKNAADVARLCCYVLSYYVSLQTSSPLIVTVNLFLYLYILNEINLILCLTI